MDTVWFNVAVALAIGLLIGLERERNKGEGPSRGPAGIRTFALAGLLGALAIHVGGVPLLAVAVGGTALLLALSYARNQDGDPGLTTEIALTLVPLLGGLAMSDTALAAAVGVAVAAILAAKAPVHRFAKRTLTEVELKDGLVFAIATLIIWPQLPDRAMGPFEALNPHKLWLLVVLVMAIGAAGHIAARAFGPRFGLPVSGLFSGFVSSTATIGSMAGRANKAPDSEPSAVAGAALSTVATFILMAALLFAVSLPTLIVMAPALGAGGLVAAVYGGVLTLRALRKGDEEGDERGRAFDVKVALILAATMAVMLVVAAGLKEGYGEAGVVIGASIAGLVDTHAAAVSLASLVASSKLAPEAVIIPILAAMTTNALSKTAMALLTGTRRFAAQVVPGLALSMAAAWGVAVLTVLL